VVLQFAANQDQFSIGEKIGEEEEEFFESLRKTRVLIRLPSI